MHAGTLVVSGIAKLIPSIIAVNNIVAVCRVLQQMARIDAFAHCSIWNRFDGRTLSLPPEAAVDGESYTNQKGGDVLIRTDLLQL